MTGVCCDFPSVTDPQRAGLSGSVSHRVLGLREQIPDRFSSLTQQGPLGRSRADGHWGDEGGALLTPGPHEAAASAREGQENEVSFCHGPRLEYYSASRRATTWRNLEDVVPRATSRSPKNKDSASPLTGDPGIVTSAESERDRGRTEFLSGEVRTF